MVFAKSMLPKGSVIVGTDISEEMIKLSKSKFEDPKNEYGMIPGNKLSIMPKELTTLGQHDWDLEAHLQNEL
jgi:hypothetical protein